MDQPGKVANPGVFIMRAVQRKLNRYQHKQNVRRTRAIFKSLGKKKETPLKLGSSLRSLPLFNGI